jgi:hypothetical protein
MALTHFRRENVSPPPLHAFLVVPIPERLALLAKADGASDKVIKRLLNVSDEDLALESDRMIQARDLFENAIDDPWSFIDESKHPELQIHQAWFRDVPSMLIGETMPAGMNSLSLKQRLSVYLVLMERPTYKWSSPEVQSYLGCTEFAVRRSIIECQKAIGGM